MEQHWGKFIRQKVAKSKYSHSELALKMNISKKELLNIYRRKNISQDLMSEFNKFLRLFSKPFHFGRILKDRARINGLPNYKMALRMNCTEKELMTIYRRKNIDADLLKRFDAIFGFHFYEQYKDYVSVKYMRQSKNTA